jgi:serine/threonine-protein kinase HipA
VLLPGARFHLTPLYDVISVQPSVDARQLQRNRMKFAMAIGDNRHYVVDTILPRHFVQTARRSGIGSLSPIFEDLRQSASVALKKVLDELPPHFPARTADSIAKGFLARLRQLESAAG